MGEEKSARYTIILGVCLLLCLLMLGRMLVGRSESEAPPDGTEPVETVPEEQQEPQLSLVMTMSESDLANFLLQYLPFTPRGLSVSIGADETASMSMSVDSWRRAVCSPAISAPRRSCCPSGARLPVNGASGRSRAGCSLPA